MKFQQTFQPAHTWVTQTHTRTTFDRWGEFCEFECRKKKWWNASESHLSGTRGMFLNRRRLPSTSSLGEREFGLFFFLVTKFAYTRSNTLCGQQGLVESIAIRSFSWLTTRSSPKKGFWKLVNQQLGKVNWKCPVRGTLQSIDWEYTPKHPDGTSQI